MDNKILQSIIDITEQRDTNSLEYSLAVTLSEVIDISEFTIYKLCTNKHITDLEITIRLSISKNKAGKTEYQWQNTDDIVHLNPLFEQCINSNGAAIEKKDDATFQLVMPIRQANTVIGIISITSNNSLTDQHPLIDGIVRIYENYLILIHENETDKLTSLYNRRTFDQKLKRLLLDQQKLSQDNNDFTENSRTYNEEDSAWLAGLDVDHFKQVNDSFGHVYGDEVLLLLAQEMKKHFRREDIIFRFGGEEFVIILAATSMENAQNILERFRIHIENFTFPQVGKITISLGLAKITDQDFPPDILEKADKALYYAKENGRNQTHCYETLVTEGKLEQSNKTGEIELF